MSPQFLCYPRYFSLQLGDVRQKLLFFPLQGLVDGFGVPLAEPVVAEKADADDGKQDHENFDGFVHLFRPNAMSV